MTKKKKETNDEVQAVEMFQPFVTDLWAGKIPVHKCVVCGWYSPHKDAIIEHVIEHMPEDEREQALEILLEE